MGNNQFLINFYRSHFGSRYKLGGCGHASLFLPVRVLQLSCFFLSIPQGHCVPVFLGFLPSLMLCSSSSACGSWPYSRGAQPVSLATFYTSFENLENRPPPSPPLLPLTLEPLGHRLIRHEILAK